MGRSSPTWVLQQHATFVFQDYGLIDEESVQYNVALSQMSLFGVNKRLNGSIESALGRVGLNRRASEKVSTLSGGGKQRVGLARAMFRSADVIFADEPTASLDSLPPLGLVPVGGHGHN